MLNVIKVYEAKVYKSLSVFLYLFIFFIFLVQHFMRNVYYIVMCSYSNAKFSFYYLFTAWLYIPKVQKCIARNLF